jgi:aspartyl-tRNA(Asn)/glutamyl-tRNA(Gln) amidotransferase subunit A
MNTYRSLQAIQQALHSDEISCSSLTQSYLDRIDKHQHLNAFLEVFEAEALSTAQARRSLGRYGHWH